MKTVYTIKVGCSDIGFESTDKRFARVVFGKVTDSCQKAHRPGSIGPAVTLWRGSSIVETWTAD